MQMKILPPGFITTKIYFSINEYFQMRVVLEVKFFVGNLNVSYRIFSFSFFYFQPIRFKIMCLPLTNNTYSHKN